MMTGDERSGGDEIVFRVRLKTGPTILGLWTVLLLLCGLFHRWRLDAPGWGDPDFPCSGFPVLLLVADGVAIALGFVLVCFPRIAGRTAPQRFCSTVYVGAVAVVALALLVGDVFRHVLFGTSFFK